MNAPARTPIFRRHKPIDIPVSLGQVIARCPDCNRHVRVAPAGEARCSNTNCGKYFKLELIARLTER